MRYILEERFILLEDDDPRDNLNNETKAKAFDLSAPTEGSSLSATDWAMKYEACKNAASKNAFWAQYLKAMLGPQAAKAKNLVGVLDKYFQESNDSFDESNPVIYLLMNLGKGSFSKINVGMVTPGSLNEIIKAFSNDDKALSAVQTALKAPLPSLLGYPDFYSASAKDQEKYLRTQKTLISKENSDWVKAFGATCTAGGKLLPARICSAQVDKKHKGSAKEIEGKAAISDKQLSAILQKVENEPDKALAVAYDLAKISFESSIAAAEKLLVDGKDSIKKQALKVSLSGEERERLGAIINQKNVKYTAKSFGQLLLELAVRSGLTKKPEEPKA